MRLRTPFVVALAVGTATALMAGGQTRSVEERITRTMRFAVSGPRSLTIDTIWGSIAVTAHDGPTVEVMARRQTRGSEEARRAAEREVALDVTDNASALVLYVDGPFRQRDRDWRREGRRDAGYEVQYDFEVRVPRDVDLRLRTVNRGSVRVEGVTGTFEIDNVNGPIDLVRIGGAGRARTVNGHVTASFRAAPAGEVELKTLNGDVEASVAGTLSADLWLKTVHGDLFTDFDVTPIAALAPAVERRGSVRVWRMPGAGVRVGAGGPAFRCETFNGDIRILRGES